MTEVTEQDIEETRRLQDAVLRCDGELTQELLAVIADFDAKAHSQGVVDGLLLFCLTYFERTPSMDEGVCQIAYALARGAINNHESKYGPVWQADWTSVLDKVRGGGAKP